MLPRAVAKFAAVGLLAAILADAGATLGFPQSRPLPAEMTWKAFFLFGASLGLGWPRTMLWALAGLGLGAVAIDGAGSGSGAANAAWGLLGFSVAVFLNRWLDGFPLPMRALGRPWLPSISPRSAEGDDRRSGS